MERKIIFEEDPVWLYNENVEWCQYCFIIVVGNEKISFCPDILAPCSFDRVKKTFSSVEELINFVKQYLERNSLSPERDFKEFMETLRKHNFIR